MEQRISMITLGVSDLHRSRAFYEAMGWTPLPAESDKIVFFDLGGLIFGLFGAEDLDADMARPNAQNGRTALAYNVRNKSEVAEILSRVESAGGTILKPAEDVFWGGHSGYFADPDGHAFEVAHNPYWTVMADGRINPKPPASSS